MLCDDGSTDDLVIVMLPSGILGHYKTIVIDGLSWSSGAIINGAKVAVISGLRI